MSKWRAWRRRSLRNRRVARLLPTTSLHSALLDRSAIILTRQAPSPRREVPCCSVPGVRARSHTAPSKTCSSPPGGHTAGMRANTGVVTFDTYHDRKVVAYGSPDLRAMECVQAGNGVVRAEDRRLTALIHSMFFFIPASPSPTPTIPRVLIRRALSARYPSMLPGP